MNVPTLLARRISLDEADVVLAKLGALASILLLGLRLFASQVFLLVIPLAVGTGCVVYLLTESDHDLRASRPTLPGRVAGFLPATVLFGLAATVALTRLSGTRTDAVYLLTGAVGAAILAQILLVEADDVATGPVLVQVLVTAVVIRLTALHVTPGYVGVDIWTHATVFVDGIARTGSFAPLSESKYLLAPFYHAIGAVGALAFGGPRSGIYLSLGILVPLSALFVYGTGALMLPARWALLATALYAFSDQFIRWGLHIIPTSLGLAFFLGAVYLVTRLFAADAERWVVGLLLVFSLAVVFTHQVSTAILLLFLGTATLVAVVLSLAETTPGRPRGTRNALALLSVFVTTVVVTLITWSNMPFSGGSTFLWQELAVISESLSEDLGFLNLASDGGSAAGGGAATQTLAAQLVPYVELFGFALLLAAAIVGGLLLLRWKVSPDIALTHTLTGGGMFVLVFGLSIFGVRVLLPGRWMAFLYVPMALLGAAGIYYVSRTGSRRLILAAFVILALGYPSTMVVAEKATLDSPAFEDQHKRFAYTESEIGAVETIRLIDPPTPDKEVGTDHPYVSLFDRLGGYRESSILILGPDGPTETERAIYRDYQSTGPATFEAAEEPPQAGTATEDAVCPADWNAVYANDDVRLCTASGGGA